METMRMLPSVLIFVVDVLAAIGHTLDLLRRTTCRIIALADAPVLDPKITSNLMLVVPISDRTV